jgi:hypothetical protein
MFKTQTPVIDSVSICDQCSYSTLRHTNNKSTYVVFSSSYRDRYIVDIVANWKENTERHCEVCGAHTVLKHNVIELAPLLAFEVNNEKNSTSNEIHFNGETMKYKMIGAIYHGSNHFILRILRDGLQSWVYDGMINNGVGEYDGVLMDTMNYNMCRGKNAVAVFYIRADS